MTNPDEETYLSKFKMFTHRNCPTSQCSKELKSSSSCHTAHMVQVCIYNATMYCELLANRTNRI